MTLHEAIQTVLNENNRPMRAKEIASAINSNGYYLRSDREPIKVDQIYARVKNYPSLFQNVNGHIVLVYDYHWKNILTSYEYLAHVLRGIFIQADIQFIIAVLFYYKRLMDINHRSGRNYPLAFDKHLLHSLDGLIDSGRSLIQGLNSLEDYRIAPDGVFEECSRLLSKLDKSKIQEIWSVVKQIDTKHLSDHEFGNIYEYLITIVSLDGNRSSLNHTPYSLRELMVELLDVKNGASLYDPVAGIGGLLIEASLKAYDGFYAYGSEINRRIAQLGNMNLAMHGLNVRIEAEDCFGQINNQKEFDYIIADLPANGITNSLEYFELYSQYNLPAPKSGKSFGAMVLFALSKLKATGKAVLTVSDGFLVKKGIEQRIRELLIQNDVIETVISLPYGTLRPYTDAKSSILILNKNKTRQLRNRVHFITANISDQTAKSVILNNDEIIRLYLAHETFEKNAQLVYFEDLRPDANLLAESYDTQFLLANTMLKEGKAKFLTDLVDVKAGVSPEKSAIYANGDIPLIKVERLSKDILDNDLKIKNIDGINDVIRYGRNIVSEECILVARIGDNLKATIFKPTNETPRILPHNNVYVLIPNNRMELSIEYLYYQLHSTFIQDQIERRKLGAVMPYISIAGLKETVIPYMTLDAQNEFVQSQKANLISEERKRVEDRIKALGYKEETKQAEADVIKTLTHQLRPKLSSLNSIANRIERVITRDKIGDAKEYNETESQNDPELEPLIVVPENYNLSQLLHKLQNETKHLSDIITNVDKVMNFNLLEEDLKEVNIVQFLKDYVKQKEMEDGFDFLISIKGDPVSVMLHEASFKDLLDQLILNASIHGFAGRHGIKNISFVVKYLKTRGIVSLEYSNNGKPFNLTQKDFITAFEKGQGSNGSGIGGNYINRVVEAHNGKLIVEEKNEKGFALTIEMPKL